ncbi:hypothetical protein AMTR_s00004p00263050 [Amborella trichopoda]|uniref:MULE transposase domain-containing protein n=1 Tax=Amborella trichopoda TaxID=13333 RepID=W1NEC5_AMBTC|nr:hypothetical protein AMTR_s00004p00263050 [Amborella trichopoda]
MIHINDDGDNANVMEGSSPIAMYVSNRPIEFDSTEYRPPTVPDNGPSRLAISRSEQLVHSEGPAGIGLEDEHDSEIKQHIDDIDPIESPYGLIVMKLQSSIFVWLQATDGTRWDIFEGKIQGDTLTVVEVDANENIFPITYAMVESETTPSWTWFLELLNEQFDERPDLPAWTIISNRQKGLQAAIEKVFPTSEQGYSMNHLIDNFKKDSRNSTLTKLYWKAARALSISDFDEYMTKIKNANAEAYG